MLVLDRKNVKNYIVQHMNYVRLRNKITMLDLNHPLIKALDD